MPIITQQQNNNSAATGQIRLTSILDVYTMLARIARGFPKAVEQNGRERYCARPQAFAVLNSWNDLDADMLNKPLSKYRNQPYFFSRFWEKNNYKAGADSYKYPLLAVVLDKSAKKLSGNKQACYTLNLILFDQMPTFCKICGQKNYCNTRTDEQQQQDLERIFSRVLNELFSLCYVHLIKDGAQIGEGWYSKPYLEQLIQSEQIDSYIPSNAQMCNYITSREIECDYFTRQHNDELALVGANIEICLDAADCEEKEEGDIIQYDIDTPPIIYSEKCVTC